MHGKSGARQHSVTTTRKGGSQITPWPRASVVYDTDRLSLRYQLLQLRSPCLIQSLMQS